MLATAVVVLVLSAPPAGLDEAKKLHDAFQFDACIKVLERAPGQKLSQRERAEVELYFGLCRFNLGQDKRAESHFELALRLQSDLELPAMTSPKIEAVWGRIKKELLGTPQKPLPPVVTAQPPEPKSGPLPPPPPPPESSSRSFVLPIVLGAAAVAACVPGVTFGLQANGAMGEARTRTFQAQIIEANQRAASLALGSNISWALAGALAVGAVVTFLLELTR